MPCRPRVEVRPLLSPRRPKPSAFIIVLACSNVEGCCMEKHREQTLKMNDQDILWQDKGKNNTKTTINSCSLLPLWMNPCWPVGSLLLLQMDLQPVPRLTLTPGQPQREPSILKQAELHHKRTWRHMTNEKDTKTSESRFVFNSEQTKGMSHKSHNSKEQCYCDN